LAYYDLLLLEYYRLLTQGLPYLEALKQSLQIVVPQITSALATSWGCVNGIVTCKATVSDKAITEVLEPKYGDIAKAYSESIRISEQITKVLFYSLDGTYMAKFGPQTVTMILALIRTFAVKGYLVFTNKCNCPEAFLPSEPVEPVEPTPIITGEEDPCTLIIQMSKTTDIFEFPTIAAGDIDRPLNDALMTKFGLNKDLNNLNEQDVEDARAKFVETMELLALKTGNPNLDPNTGEIAVTIDNYFDNLSSEGEFSLVDFMLFVAAVRIQSNFGTNNVITKNIPRGIFGNSATLELLLNVGVDYGTDALEAETSITYEEIVSECPDSMALEARVNSYIADQQEIKEGEFEISCDCIPGDVIEQKCKITMLATVLPKPVIFEVPYFIASAKVNNSLPIAPDVQFIPYKDVSDTILINLNTMEGQYRTKFVPILSSDYDYYNNLRTARSLDENELLEFSNDDDIRYYESFRIEYHPRGFEDFASSTYRKHKTNKRTKTDYLQSIVYEEIDDRIYSNSTSFDEVLLPNQKYYYLFRSVDKAGNISNPSRIFEVQLVSDSGATYPVIRTVEFITTDIMANSRDMKRFLILNPTFSHVSPLLFGEKKITEGATSAFDVLKDYQADTSIEHSLWDKRFKIRVTSLKSGRKLDININPVINIIDERTTCDTGPAQPTGLTSTRT
jgi:hypothetical protein